MPPDWLPHLDTFAEVAEAASLTAAAHRLDLTRQAVADHITALQESVGVVLLTRTDRKLELTPAGRQLLDHARNILTLHRHARRVLAGREAPIAGDVSVVAGSVAGEHLLPDLVAAFVRMHPHVRVRADVTGSSEAVERVERGEADVGLAGHPPESPHLESRRVARDRMVVVVPPEHPLADRDRVSLDRLAGHPLILRGPGSGLRRGLEVVLKRAGMSLSDLQVAAELGSDVAVREAVLNGAGAGVLTTLVVRKDVAAGRLVAIKVWGVRCDRDVYAVTCRDRALAPPVRLFLALAGASPADDLDP
jgi:DNA-binding transcriptional LysR family regulator